jgi:hypothetical protein|tara:strand:+ start:3330 stop:5375 length:2046 start_codon:yes stop_codon:yes gene_type:complete
MANNQVEIDVVLNAEQAEQGFDKLEQGSKAVGESFSSVGKAVSSLGGEANQALGGVGESLSGVVDGFGELATAAKSGGASFTALAGPIGIAVVAVMELIQAFKEYSSEVSGANIKVEAYQSSVTELTSIIEELSDAQVKLNKADIEAFRIQSQRAQALTAEGELLNQKGATLRAEIALQKDAIAEIEKKTKSESTYYVQKLYFETVIATKRREIASLEAKLAPITQKADNTAIKGAEQRLKLTEMREEKLKESPEFIKKQAELEAKILNEANRNQLQATKSTVDTQIKIARLASKQKERELKAIEDISEQVRSKAIAGERARLQAEITAIEKSAADKRKAEAEKRRQKRQADRAREAAMELAKARQLQAELRNIRMLELESMRLQGASAIELAVERFNDEVALADGSANKIIIANKRYQNEITKIQEDAQEKRFAEEKQFAQQRSNFIFETLEFDAQQIKDQTARELALLDLRYEKEIRLNEHTQEEITELQRRESIERQKIQKQSIDAQIQQVGEFANQYGAGLAEAAYASLLFGESFKESVGNILISLGQQAAVQSLMETAKGTAALILNPAGASNHFLAAGLFAGAAASAGIAGKAMGGGGGGAVATTSTGAVSPTGTPQTATTPDREQAETSSMVFNINFGGAVIYDTKKSAEQALADRITNIQNTRRRGAPRRGAM